MIMVVDMNGLLLAGVVNITVTITCFLTTV